MFERATPNRIGTGRIVGAVVAGFILSGVHAMAQPDLDTKQAAPPSDIEDLFNTSAVIDGNASYYCPDSQVGQPNFERDENNETVKQATGINIASMSLNVRYVGGELFDYYAHESDRFARGYYTGARLIRTGADLDTAIKDGEHGVLFYTQVHYPLEGSVSNIQGWFDDGLRAFQLAYGSGSNQDPQEKLGGGTDEEGGLTPLGYLVVDELIRLGIVIDVSHCNEQTILETAAIAIEHGVPITAKHTVAYELRIDDRFDRGASDLSLQRIADTGGVIGVMAYGPWIDRDPTDGDARLNDYLAHLIYIVDLVGVEHVGLATDGYLDGSWPAGRESGDGLIDSPDRWKYVIERFRARTDASDENLRKLMGENFLRVYRRDLPSACGTADMDRNGLIDTNDFVDFLSAYTRASPRADFDADGRIDSLDFLSFLEAFGRGC